MYTEDVKEVWNKVYEDGLSLFEFLDRLVFYLKNKWNCKIPEWDEFVIRVCGCRLWREKFGSPLAGAGNVRNKRKKSLLY